MSTKPQLVFSHATPYEANKNPTLKAGFISHLNRNSLFTMTQIE